MGSVPEARDIDKLAEHLSGATLVHPPWFDGTFDREALRGPAEEGRSRQKSYRDALAQLESLSGTRLLELPVEGLLERFTTTYATVRRQLNGDFRREMGVIKAAWSGAESAKANYKNAVAALERAVICVTESKWGDANDERLGELFGPLYSGFETDWDEIDRTANWAEELLKQLDPEPPGAALLDLLDRPDDLASLGEESHEALTDMFQRLSEAAQSLAVLYPGVLIDDAPVESAAFASLDAWLAQKIEDFPRLQEWAAFQRASLASDEAGMGEFIRAILEDPVSVDQVIPAFWKHFYKRWWSEAQEASPTLRDFSGLEHDQLVDEYRRLDREIMDISARHTLAQVESFRPVPAVTTSRATSQMTSLLRELQKKGRHNSLQTLPSEIPQLVQAAKPCLLMSPISVSSYLAQGRYSFDLVIFDEASQIPPESAIASILRARQVVVLGDDRQLPPTDRSPGTLEGNADGSDETPAESILDECAALPAFKSVRLTRHYRSKDERLIAYSNRRFYSGGLTTFPSSSGESPSVRFDHVESASPGERTPAANRTEAEHVARLVFSHFEEFGESRSLGVITLSRAQELAIDEELRRLKPTAPHLAPLLAGDGVEPLFVKNVENVQGDERDHTIISVGYGNDSASEGFGPIGRVGGERRLNVAVTRARRQTVVCASFRPQEMGPCVPERWSRRAPALPRIRRKR